MKKSVIGICISLLCVGSSIYANQQNNASSPVVSTVTKSTKDSKVNTNESKSKVSKHGETEKLEEVGNATNSETQKKTDAASKESSSVKTEVKSSTKAETKSPVSSEGKKKLQVIKQIPQRKIIQQLVLQVQIQAKNLK